MRILIYSYNYYPEPIGIAPLMTELAEGLVLRGHEVRVVTAMPNYPQRVIYPEYRGQLYCQERRNGVLIQRCYVSIRPKPGLVGRMMLEGSFVGLSLLQALRGWRPDLILATSPSLPACVPVALLKQIYRCPTILNLQDILPEAAIHTGLLSNRLGIRVFESLERFAYGSATCISVIADGFRDNLLSKGVSAAKISNIPNWVDVDFIRPIPKQESQFAREHRLLDKFVVLYSGNIARTQGIRNAIRSARVLSKHPEIRLVIVGEESHLRELETFRQELGADNVLLLPFVDREALPDMLGAADIGLIMQKRNVVGFNMPSKTQLLLSSGSPIVASVPRSGTAAEAVLASGGGIVVQPENPTALAKGILDLYHNPEQAKKLGRQGRLYALKHYSFERALESYEQLFELLLHHPNARLESTDRPDFSCRLGSKKLGIQTLRSGPHRL
ncbi:colanic acid biosynthesis glycosyltransferase WcaI [filamentous cyanobacterium CCP5]|nr:colanic acid biosynthesis glycosyltransferase WcaI [filamentous cyanobacterium CCP5]